MRNPDNDPSASRPDVLILQIHRGPTGAVVVRLAGDLDRWSAPTLAACLDDVIASPTTPESVTVDAAGLGFLDLGGLDVLVTAARQAQRFGRKIRLTGCSPLLLRLVRIVEVGDAFEAIEGRESGEPSAGDPPANPQARPRTLRSVDHQPSTCRPLPRRSARSTGSAFG